MAKLVMPLTVAAGLVGGLLATSPAAAQGECIEWGVRNWIDATQGNNWFVIFWLRQDGTKILGTAEYNTIGSDDDNLTGSISGSLSGNEIRIDTSWGGVYKGTIDANGRIEGTTYHKNNTGTRAWWRTDVPLNCVKRKTPKPAPPPVAANDVVLGNAPNIPIAGSAPKPAQPATTAKVNADVDLYDLPGGSGKVIGLLRQGQTVTLAAACGNDWCEIAKPKGWAWGEFLD